MGEAAGTMPRPCESLRVIDFSQSHPGALAAMVLADAGEPLRLLAVSTLHDADVVSHPDSGKIGVFSRQPLKMEAGQAVKGMFLHTDTPVSIWSGEKGDPA